MTHDILQACPCAQLVSEKTSRDIKRAPAVTARATAILLTMAFHDQSRAAEASVPGVPQAELVQWEVGLRQAGASPLEVKQFEELLHRQSAREYFESAPPNFF